MMSASSSKEEFSVNALVLRRTDLGESDRKLVLLTQERGKIDVVARGARKAGSKLASASDPLSVGVYHLAPGKRWAYVTQVQPISSLRGLRQDYNRLIYALAYCELVDLSNPHDLRNDDLFTEVLTALIAIESQPNPEAALLWAELRLLQIEGIAPSWKICTATGLDLGETPAWVSPTAGGFITQSQSNSYADRFQVDAEILIGLDLLSQRAKPPEKFRKVKESLETLHKWWRHHLDRQLPAHEQLLQQIQIEATSATARLPD